MIGSSVIALWLAACDDEPPPPTPTATPRSSLIAPSLSPPAAQDMPAHTQTPTQSPTQTAIPAITLEAAVYPFQSPVALHYPEIPPEYLSAVDNLPLNGLTEHALQGIARDLRFVETATQEVTADEQLMYRSDYVPEGLVEVSQEAIASPDYTGGAGLNLPDDYLVYIDSRLIPTLRRIHQVAVTNDVTLLLANAYRGYEHQETIYGPGDFIAYPGTSSHQSGFAIDLFMFDPSANASRIPSTRVVGLLLDDPVLQDCLIHLFGMGDPPHFLALPPTLARLLNLSAEDLGRDYNHLSEQDLVLLQAAFYRSLTVTITHESESGG